MVNVENCQVLKGNWADVKKIKSVSDPAGGEKNLTQAAAKFIFFVKNYNFAIS